MKFGVGVVYKSSSKRDIHESWLIDSHALLKGVNEFLAILGTFLDQFGRNSVQEIST
jgi:hypothetical protein